MLNVRVVVAGMRFDNDWNDKQHYESSKCVDEREDCETVEATSSWLAAHLIELVFATIGHCF